MRRLLVIFILIFTTASLIAQEPAMATHGLRTWESRTQLFTNARIVVAPGNIIEAGSLLVVDGMVEAVGQNVRRPAGVVERDLRGRTVYPGFVDPYTEYGLKDVGPLNQRSDDDSPRYEAEARGRAHWNESIHADRQWVDRFKPDSEAAEKLMQRGVVAVQSGKMDGVFRGAAFAVSLGEGSPHELILDPRTMQWLSFSKGSSRQEYPSSLMGSIALIRQILYDAQWAKRAGSAGEPVAEAVATLASWEGPWLFDTDEELTLLRAATIGREFDLPLIFIGSNREFQRLDSIRGLDSPIILPLSFPKTPNVKTLEEELDVTLEDLRVWERAPSNPATLAAAGVRFAFTGHGLRKDEDFLSNLRTAIARGLSPDAALAALTTVPAALSGVEDSLGTLERGKRADFIVVDGDLFAEDGEATIESIWIRGRLAKEFVDDDEHDFRGTYQITLGDRTYTVRLTGERTELVGEIVEGETVVPIRDIKATLDSLTFQAPMEEFDIEGVARFSINAIQDEVVGQVNLPGGMPIQVMMDRRPVEVEEPEGDLAVADTTVGDDDEEKKTVRDEPVVSRLTYPNIGLGYDTIPAQENVLIRNATIWTMDDAGVIEAGDLLIVDGKIASVGESLDAPAGVTVIDGTGRHVTPGMIDEHSHLAIARGVNEGSNVVTAEVRIGDVVHSDDVGVYRALAGGTTTAQLLHGSANPIGGQAQVVKFRWGRLPEEMKFDAAPPSIKFALGENVKQSNWGDDYRVRYPQSRMGVETIMRDRFLAAREYAGEWRAWNDASRRERERMTPPRRDLQFETLVEILEGERFVHSHSYVQSEILMLIRLAEELGFTVQTFTHILEGYKVAPEMAAHGAGGSTFSDWWAYKFEVYDAIPYNPCLMHEAGVLTSINSDSAELIRRLNQEAAKSVMYCGMNQVDALAMATINPAKQLKIDHRIGSLRAGKDADFVIWSDHPLSIYATAEQTWVDGTPYFTIEKDRELRARLQEEKSALVQKVLRAGTDQRSDDSDESDNSDEEDPSWSEILYECETNIDVWSIEGEGR